MVMVKKFIVRILVDKENISMGGITLYEIMK